MLEIYFRGEVCLVGSSLLIVVGLVDVGVGWSFRVVVWFLFGFYLLFFLSVCCFVFEVVNWEF